MKHLDLFSGIGGFALAAEMAWPDEEVEHIFCDNEPFSQAVLKKHWPNSLIYGDIKELKKTGATLTHTIGEHLRGKPRDLAQEERSKPPQPEVSRERWDAPCSCDSGLGRIDLLTGGFPCQPFSAAGRRRGTEDDRHLWPEMLRVIRECRPTFVLGENVGGFLTWDGGMVFEQVCTDLEAEGYEVCPLVIPACALNAPHRRDRVWIAAHYTGSRTGKDKQGIRRLPKRHHQWKQRETHTPSWTEDWPTIAARLCTLDDGLRYDVVGLDGRTNAEVRPRPKGWRNAALKGAGNAIVPQVAAQILLAMKEVDGVL